MTRQPLRLALMFLGVPLAFAPPAEAQRSGFIIGLGLGPGLASYTASSGSVSLDRENKLGVATDFHIGGVIGDSFELYYVNKWIFLHTTDRVAIVATGVSGVGFTYPLNPDFSISGGIGVGVWKEIWDEDPPLRMETYTGLGLLAGGRYQLSESGRWMLNFDIMYAKPGDDVLDRNVLGVQFTISAMSH